MITQKYIPIIARGGSIFGKIKPHCVFMLNSYRIETCPSGQEFAIYDVPTFLVS